MRLGAPVYLSTNDPAELAREHRRLGYRAAYAPHFAKLDDPAMVRKTEEAFKAEGVIISEVGAWCNPLSGDADTAAKAIAYMKQQLALADELGAECCVNILGSHSPTNWDGPHEDGYTEAFFEECVAVTRDIIDAVKPKRTKLSYEMMPFYFLDSADEYLRLIKAVDRSAIGVHLDFANCVASPRIYYNTAALINDCFDKIGENILSVHVKDIKIRSGVCTAMFEEVPIGQGNMDFTTLLTRANALSRDLPLMLEHLPSEEVYLEAAKAMKEKASALGLRFE